MDIYAIFDSVRGIVEENLLVSLAFGVLFLIMLIRRPKLALSLLGVGIVLAAVFYLISDLSGKGAYNKERMSETQVPRE